MSEFDLDSLERRVGEKWAAAAAARTPQWAELEIDMSSWFDVTQVPLPHNAWGMSTVGQPLPPLLPDTPQFPREQWASYPNKRTLALLLSERLLDDAENLTDEQWIQLCLVIQYGGKTRIA